MRCISKMINLLRESIKILRLSTLKICMNMNKSSITDTDAKDTLNMKIYKAK